MRGARFGRFEAVHLTHLVYTFRIRSEALARFLFGHVIPRGAEPAGDRIGYASALLNDDLHFDMLDYGRFLFARLRVFRSMSK